MARHPATFSWSFPPERPEAEGLSRTNLRELAARPERFEHHLMVVGRAGDAQLELVTASEPLFFAHANISDEYALALPTGDALLDGFPLRTFLLAEESAEIVARLNHRVGQLVLHPHGLLHWPGMLRAPYEPPMFPGPRRCGLSLVFCASTPTPPADRPLFVSPGLDAEVKAYSGAPPFLLADLGTEPSRTVARIGDAAMDLVVAPNAIEGPALVVVLEADSPWFACDLIHVPEGARIEGVRRALVVTAPEISPPPPSWQTCPPSPFTPHPECERVPLPLEINGLSVEESSPSRVRITARGKSAEVPRYWLARMLFRIALHNYGLGYLETYEGFFYDDRRGHRLGVRGASIDFTPSSIDAAVTMLYRAVAPSGYGERLA